MLNSLFLIIVAFLFGFSYIFLFLVLLVLTVWMYFVNGSIFIILLVIVLFKIYGLFDGSEFRIKNYERTFLSKIVTKGIYHYFPLTLHLDEDVKKKIIDITKNGKFIIGSHPHGVMAISNHVFDQGEYGELARHGLGELKIKKLAAQVMFKIPFTRDMNIYWFDAVDASRKMARKVMESKDWNMFIAVGGEREQLLCQVDPNIVYVKKRKGFVRIAMQYGATIIPSYSFGESDLYRSNWLTKICMGFRLWVVKKFGIALIIPWGNLIFPPMALKIPMNVVLGNPIYVKKIESEEDLKNEDLIQEYLGKYITELENVFEKNKKKFGYDNRNLIVK